LVCDFKRDRKKVRLKDMSDNQEKQLFEATKYTYPKGYFRIQAEYAKKVFELGITESYSEALLKYTSVYRRISGEKKFNTDNISPKWSELVSKIESGTGTSDPYLATEMMWSSFTEGEGNIYHAEELKEDEHHVGGYIFKDSIDNESGEQKIELHFNDRYRGQSKDFFSREKIEERINDLRKIFQFVRERMNNDENYKPKLVVCGSWMNSYSIIQKALPEDFVATGEDLFPPKLSFKGASLWGQFLNSEGGVNQDRYGRFLNNLEEAKNLDDLVKAFPVPVRLFRGPIEIFFEEYGI
jgi:hypothetical protein